jgi:nucleotide-binding universal stress UspA family protein
MAGIVVGYDGNESSRAALDVAIGLAKQLGEPIVAVFGYGVNPMGGEVKDQVEALKERGQGITAEAVERARAQGVEAEVALVPAEASEALTTTAQERYARMIAVGTYGEGPIRGAILGSTAYRLVHTSETPVLVVRS